MIMEEEEEMSTTFLPQEIVMNILSRLPANSLVSIFKLVCKDWRNLIKDPDFVKMHLNRRRRRRASINNNSLICKSGNDLFQLHPPFNLEGGLPPPPPPIAKTKLDFDPLSWCGWDLVGSCNGLVCLSVDFDIIVLLNPSTRRYKISPKQPIVYHKGDFSSKGNTYGFGCCFNSTTNIDEYKFVRIEFLLGSNSSRYQADIYSMSSNSWRTETNTIIDFACGIGCDLQSGVLVNEALHWVATGFTDRSWHAIVSFDIRDEKFRQQLPIPLSFHPTAYNDPYYQRNELILMNMKGCLSMVHFKIGRYKNGPDLDIWVMKEYGIKESWTKEFVIRSWDTDPPRALSNLEISWRSNVYVLKGDQILIEGLTHTKEGIRSLEEYRKLVLYDINERKIHGDFKMFGVPDQPYPRVDQVEYIETLVSLKSTTIMAEE